MISPLRFGWISTAHNAIQEEAVSLLPESSLQGFLQKNEFRVDYFSQREDEEFSRKGPRHFLSVAQFWQETPNPGNGLDRKPFRKIRRFFSALAREERAEAFAREPLTPSQLDALGVSGQKNVYQSVIDNYQALVDAFGELKRLEGGLKRGQALEGKTRYDLNYRLAELSGQLSHFIGDLYQPMHGTFYDWEIPAPAKSAHFAMDGLLFSDSRHKQDFTAWREQFRQQRIQRRFEAEALSLDEIKGLLARGLEANYMKLYDIVQADAHARDTSFKFLIFGTDKARYQEKIHAAWSPIIQQQMNLAAEMTATLFHSAYTTAGSPNLGLLD